jgi:two-component system, NarL family, nitrate/nitrite response regulator NarL
MTPTVRIAIVDDHPTLLAGLSAILSDERYSIVGTGGTASEVVSLAASGPHVMLVDLSMPGDVFAAIEAVSADTTVIVFTAYAEVALATRAMDAGARGFLLKGRPVDELHAAIDATLTGQIFISPELASRVAPALRSENRAAKAQPQLSARERQLLECLFEAMTNKEIARKLELSEKTVKHYMTNLMNKLNARNRLEAVIAASALRAGKPLSAVPAAEELEER